MSRRTLLGSSGYHPMLRAVIDYYFLYGYSWANFPTTAWLNNLNTFYYDLQTYGFISGTAQIKLEYLYLWAIESLSVDFGRINLVRPSFSVMTGSPGFLSKFGIGNNIGQLDVPFRLFDAGANDFLVGTNLYNCTYGVWSKVGGPEAVFYNMMISGGATNSRVTRISARTNPRTDALLNLTTASPFIIQNGATQGNTIYGIGARSSILPYSFVNGTEGAGASGNASPDNTTIVFSVLYPNRYLGGAFAGPAWYTADIANFNTVLQAFNSRL